MDMSAEELLFRIRHFCTASIFSEALSFQKKKFFRKAIFRISYFFWRVTFLERLLFQKRFLSITATFSEELFLHKKFFQKRYYFTATLVSTATLPINQLALGGFSNNCVLINCGSSLLCIYYCSKSHDIYLIRCTQYCRTASSWWVSYFFE